MNVRNNGVSIGVFNMTGGGRAIIHSLGERDFIQGTGVLPLDVFAGDGNDTIYGTGVGDVLRGEGGNDFIDGRSGHDVLVGGYGRDTLNGVKWLGGPRDEHLD